MEECTQKERIMSTEMQINNLIGLLNGIKISTDQILRILNGNGNDGLVTKVALNKKSIDECDRDIKILERSNFFIIKMCGLSASIGAALSFIGQKVL